MKLIPGDIGTFLGLRVDGHARVLDSQGTPSGACMPPETT